MVQNPLEMKLDDELLSKLLNTPDGVNVTLALMFKQLNTRIEEVSTKLDAILADQVPIKVHVELKQDFEIFKKESEYKIRSLEDLKIKIYAYAALLPICVAILVKVWK